MLIQTGFISFFGSLGLAALSGGTVHGFFPGPETLGHRILWPMTLLLLGVTGVSAWVTSAAIQFSVIVVQWVVMVAITLFIIYSLAVLLVTQAFWIAILFYLPAALSMFLVFLLGYYRLRERLLLIGILGFLLTFTAAAVQVGHVGLHPVYFNHNALYHMIQAVALFMIFKGAQWFIKQPVIK